MDELPNVPQKLEALVFNWRKFPLLVAAASNAKLILEHPDKYVRQDKNYPKDIISLVEETQNGQNPLTGITYLYDISPVPNKNKTSREKEFLQIHFQLCSPISTPQSDDFEPHLSIIRAVVADNGDILPMTAQQWELQVKRSGFARNPKIELAIPEILPKETLIDLRSKISKLSETPTTTEPYKTTYFAWTGAEVNILPTSAK
jgi:hypothetical protein